MTSIAPMPMELLQASGTRCPPRWKVASRSCDIRGSFNDTKNLSFMSRRICSALSMLFAVPATALAFDSVDLIPYTSSGAYPAYPGDDVRPLSGFVEAGLEYDSNPFRLSD